MRIAIVTTVLGLALTLALGGKAQADSFDNQMSLKRNELRSEYRKVNKDLAAVEQEMEKQDDGTTITGSASTVWAVQTSMRDQAAKLRARRNELRERQDAIRREFKQLTRQIEERYDDIPIWWGTLE
jgi:hypothetical protein